MRRSVADIVCHRAGEQAAVLGHQSDGLAQLPRSQVGQVVSVEQNPFQLRMDSCSLQHDALPARDPVNPGEVVASQPVPPNISLWPSVTVPPSVAIAGTRDAELYRSVRWTPLRPMGGK